MDTRSTATWRRVRLAQIPIGVLAVAFGVWNLRQSHAVLGVVVIVLGVAGALIAIVQLRRSNYVRS